MVGLPNEKKEDIKHTATFIRKTIMMGCLPRWVTPLIILPGTEVYNRADKYKIKIRMKTFDDFMAFSTVTRKKVSWYPELITHETEELSVRDILRAAAELKISIYSMSDLIIEKIRKNYKKFAKYHPHWSKRELEEYTKGCVEWILQSHF